MKRKSKIKLPSWTYAELRAQMEKAARVYDYASRVYEQCVLDSEKLRRMAKVSHAANGPTLLASFWWRQEPSWPAYYPSLRRDVPACDPS